MEEKQMNFNKTLQQLRKKAGMSQEELAEQLGVSRQTISKWEKGLSVPDAEMLLRLAEGFGVKESLLTALIRRYSRLRLADTHLLELCAGPNCGKHTQLAALAEQGLSLAGAVQDYTDPATGRGYMCFPIRKLD